MATVIALSTAWVGSQPASLPFRFLEGAEVKYRQSWAEAGGKRIKDNGTYRLARPLVEVSSALEEEVRGEKWQVRRKPDSVQFSRGANYITLLDRGDSTTVHVQRYRQVEFSDRLRQWLRKIRF